MVSRETKLRWRRVFRRRRRQAEALGAVTEDNLDRYVFRRLMRLVAVRRFVIGWMLLCVVMSVAVVLQTNALQSFYKESVPVAGGTFREGMVGTFTNANPLFAQSEVDAAASRLLFSGLFSHDMQGALQPDIAERYEIDQTETVYTVHLKDNVFWHDGQPVTAQDVEFTYGLIQNPETKSYLLNSWQGVTVKATGDRVVTFTLSNALSSFPHSLTNGIIPHHILKDVPPSQLRASSFNTSQPVGSGPFVFQTVEIVDDAEGKNVTRFAMTKNSAYHNGAPQLDRFVVRTYSSEEAVIKAFESSEVDAVFGLKVVPESVDPNDAQSFYIPLAGQVMVFLKNSHEILQNSEVRRALVLTVDKQAVFDAAFEVPVLSVNGPLLRSHVGYNEAYDQITNNKEEAKKILDTAGWEADPLTGIRSKDGKPLKFRLFGSASSEFTGVSGSLQSQWREVGAEVEVVLQAEEDLRSSVSGHTYDALMYGISVGADPDVYAYWHSTQGDVRSGTRLNFSEYKSAVADKALEAGRTRSDEQNRAVKYKPFLEVWQKDNPALALYQPQFLYLTTEDLNGFEYGVAQSATDRYQNVNEWQVRFDTKNILE